MNWPPGCQTGQLYGDGDGLVYGGQGFPLLKSTVLSLHETAKQRNTNTIPTFLPCTVIILLQPHPVVSHLGLLHDSPKRDPNESPESLPSYSLIHDLPEEGGLFRITLVNLLTTDFRFGPVWIDRDIDTTANICRLVELLQLGHA